MAGWIESLRKKRETRHNPENLARLRVKVARRDAVVAMQTTDGWKQLQIEVQAISTAHYTKMISIEVLPADAEKERLCLVGINALEHALSRICTAGDNAEKELEELDNDRNKRSRRRPDQRNGNVPGNPTARIGVRENAPRY